MRAQKEPGILRRVAVMAGLLMLPACAETSLVSHMAKQVDLDLGPEVNALGNLAAPDRGGRYKIGLPYSVKGITYTPTVDYGYDQVGIASWYGPGFHGELTANGERYDSDLLTAAHKTLPMPSLVRVTNLENGRAIVVRVNDRGPFASGRIIDMSRRGAKLLGFERKGTAKVRVQILARESRIIAAVAQGKPVPGGLMLAKAPPPVPDPKPLQAIAEQIEPAAVVSSVPLPVRQKPVPDASSRVALAGFGLPLAVEETSSALYVQLAAFHDAVTADRLRDRVNALGPATVYRADLDTGTYFRVRLGPLGSREAAERLLAQAVQAGYPSARIVAD